MVALAAPEALQAALERLAQHQQGKAAILVRSIDDGWVAGYRGASIFPQGSLRRLWLAIALLDAVDRGELALEQRVPIGTDGGSRATTAPARQAQIVELLRAAVAQNDPEAQDHILDGLTGPAGMADLLEEKGLAEVGYGPSNRDLERSRERAASVPPDGATPDGVARGLAELVSEKLLSPGSTKLLLDLFVQEAVEPGARIMRLSGRVHGSRSMVDEREVAVLHSPSGRRYAIVLFATDAVGAEGRGEQTLRDVVEAVLRSEEPLRHADERTALPHP